MFAKVIIAVFAIIALSSHVSAHGHISTSINGDLDVRFTDAGVDKCGVQTAESEAKRNAGMAAPVAVSRDGVSTFAFQITNADGAGPLSANIDPTCQGETFNVAAEVTQNIPGTAGNHPTPGELPKFYEFKVKFPGDMKCTCGPSKNLCMMQITTPQSFTSCAFIMPLDKPKDLGKRTSFMSQFNSNPYLFSPSAPPSSQPQFPGNSFGMPQYPNSFSYGQQQQFGGQYYNNQRPQAPMPFYNPYGQNIPQNYRGNFNTQQPQYRGQQYSQRRQFNPQQAPAPYSGFNSGFRGF